MPQILNHVEVYPFPSFLEGLFSLHYATVFKTEVSPIQYVKLSRCHELPESQGIYFLVTEGAADDEHRTLEYIGISKNLKNRFCVRADSLSDERLQWDWCLDQGIFYVPSEDAYPVADDKWVFRHHAMCNLPGWYLWNPYEYESCHEMFVYFFEIPKISWDHLSLYEKAAIGIFHPPCNKTLKHWLREATHDELQKLSSMLVLDHMCSVSTAAIHYH